MKKFRQKQYTIQEGHYTGPKDMDKVPGAIEVIGKSAIGGAIVGGIAGKVLDDTTVSQGIITGGKAGTLAGIFFKLFLNYLHNPMSSVKYNNVDKLIRREFGIYRISGVTMGDSLDKRASIDEKFSFNDRDVCKYKVNFVIADNKISMYTFDMTDEQLTKTSNLLDYYCKKYVKMEYSSTVINRKLNAYCVNIIFTNYQVISNFIMELSQVLEVKINILDNKALVDTRITNTFTPKEKTDSIEEQKEYSSIGSLGMAKFRSAMSKTGEKLIDITGLSKYDLTKLLINGGTVSLNILMKGGKALNATVIGTLYGVLSKMSSNELDKIPGIPRARGDFNNNYLKELLNKLHYIENINFTTGDSDNPVNMSLVSGVFLVSVDKKSSEYKNIDSGWYKKFASKIKRIDAGNNVIAYSYIVKDTKELELILNTLMRLKINNLNIYN